MEMEVRGGGGAATEKGESGKNVDGEEDEVAPSETQNSNSQIQI